MGFGRQILDWLASFLSNRSQCVRIHDSLSKSISVTSGVPQGSHCGPILFVLFMNDLPDVIKSCKLLIFADDVKIFHTVETSIDSKGIQDDLNNFLKWCSINGLRVNSKKCFIITFARIQNKTVEKYVMGSDELERVDFIKDLGVIFDKELSFVQHVTKISLRALKSLGFICRTAKHFSINTLKKLYCSLVRSHLEYASVVWSPIYDVHKFKLERVQNKFLRVLNYRLGIPIDLICYHDLRHTFNLKTLVNRRILADLCFLHKLLGGAINCSVLISKVSFKIYNNNYNTRTRSVFLVPQCNTNYTIYSPINRLLRLGNIVASNTNLELFGSIYGSFKRALIFVNLDC